MSLENIIGKILDDARAEAERIKSDYAGKADGIREEEKRRAEQLASDLLREAEREAGLEAGKITTQARLERRIELLTAKKKLIAEVLERALPKERFDDRPLMVKIISKDDVKEEPLDYARFMERAGPELENVIIDILKI